MRIGAAMQKEVFARETPMSPLDDQIQPRPAPQACAGVEPSTELGLFRRFAVEMIAIQSEDALLWHVARNVVGRMNFNDCVVYGFDPARKVLRQAAAIGDKTPASQPDIIVNQLTIPLGEGITGAVAQSRIPLIINDLRADPRYIPDISEARSEVCVPILNGDELLGVIDCEHPTPHRFGPNELELLTAVAALTAAQITQCRMIRNDHSTRQELAQALESSERAQRGQHRFLANASHELRTPLNSIIGFASLLTRPGYFAEDPQRCEAQAATILEAGQQLATLVNDILEITAAAGGQLAPVPECLDIVWEAEEATLKFRDQPGQAEILFEVMGEPETMQAWCDIRHLHKILVKLTEHAILVSEPGCPVNIRIARQNDRVDITVCDRGASIPANSLESVFAPFGREPGSASSGSRGAGLGLTLARELAQANLADISVVSLPGGGNEFTLRLPALMEADSLDQDGSA